MLAGDPRNLPATAKKAFRNWLGISESLRDLFDRAPCEAIVDPESVLARMAIEEIGKCGYPDSITAVVRERAEEVLVQSAKRSGWLVEKAIEEPKRLTKAMDDFVALFNSTHNRFSVNESELRVREFLENCRRLDRVLSDIPRKILKGGI